MMTVKMKLMMRAIIDLPSKNTAWRNAFNFRQLSYQLTELHLGKNLYQKWIFIEIVSFMGHDIVIFVAMFYLHNVQLLPCLWPEVVLKSGLVFPVSASALHNPKRFSLIIITFIFNVIFVAAMHFFGGWTGLPNLAKEILLCIVSKYIF